MYLFAYRIFSSKLDGHPYYAFFINNFRHLQKSRQGQLKPSKNKMAGETNKNSLAAGSTAGTSIMDLYKEEGTLDRRRLT